MPKLKYIGPYPTARVGKFNIEGLRIGDVREVPEKGVLELLKTGSFVRTSDPVTKQIPNLEEMNMTELREFATKHNLKSKDNDKETLRKELLQEIEERGGL